MQFNHEQDLQSYAIKAYGTGHVDVTLPLGTEPPNDDAPRFERLTDSFIMTPGQLIRDWEPNGLDDLAADHFQVLLELRPEVVLLGTGETLQFPDMVIMSSFMEQGIGFEVMNTAAACRTYNILMNEGRKVAAALLQG